MWILALRRRKWFIGGLLLMVFPGWLTLWLAVVGDMGSSLLVTRNAMRLLRDGYREERR
jgi:Cd2+/Zn2+-exporting ATPase